ncbi:hypothetical protein PG993_007829 [Apiospora rasikravindrae]|uniref:Uncharacterized protein n=1 Tax=Apiospora rasikravindrae TaxID=990691 RepID=A0ABR1SYK6_9PEZI
MNTGTSDLHDDPDANTRPQHGIFMDDRTKSELHTVRYVPYPDLTALESLVSSSTNVEEVTTRWECKHQMVPVLVIEAKPVFEPIRANL